MSDQPSLRVIRYFVPNSLQNYNHLVICPHSRQAAAIDPFCADLCQQQLQHHRLQLTDICITHSHHDHVRGTARLRQYYPSARIWIPHNSPALPYPYNTLVDGQTLAIGQGQLRVLATPGHTADHMIYLSHQPGTAPVFALCADTVFNAGVGHTRNGDSATLFRTIQQLKQHLAMETLIYPGHDYIQTNLRFAQTIEPDNPAIAHQLHQANSLNSDTRMCCTWQQELSYNPFLRIHLPAIKTALGLSSADSDEQAFIVLRQRRDQW